MLPRETILALFPEGRTVKRKWPLRPLRLSPPTLAHAAAMEAIGCGMLNGFIDDANALVAAWLLTKKPEEAAKAANGDLKGLVLFAERCKGVLADVSLAVNTLVADALLPFVPAKNDGSEDVLKDGMPKGYGWPLEITEALCSRYSWGFKEALATPVATALALMAVGRGNSGGASGGPDYYDRIRLERWKKMGLLGGVRKEAHNG